MSTLACFDPAKVAVLTCAAIMFVIGVGIYGFALGRHSP